MICDQLSRVSVNTELSDVDEALLLASPTSASAQLLTNLTSLDDCTGMASSDQLQQHRLDKTTLMDSETSDCHDDLVSNMELLGVDVRPTTMLPDILATNDVVQQGATNRRRQVRARLSAGGGGSDKVRRKTLSAMANSSSSVTAAAVRSRLACNSRSKRRARVRVHAVC